MGTWLSIKGEKNKKNMCDMSLACRNINGAAAVENSLVVLERIKCRIAI